jgi:hypothetical protein
MTNKAVSYAQKNFDEVAIIGALASLAFSDNATELSDTNLAVLAVLRRSNQSLADSSLSEIGDYLQNFDTEQITGLISNVKGILHEMEFVRIENEDGDSVYATIFNDTNHAGTDVQLIDQTTGETWEIQLRATNNQNYVQKWIDDNPNGDIFITEELAQKMNLPTSGQSNEELTINVETFVDKMLEMDDESLWNYVPALTLVSSSIVVWTLWRKYQNNEITLETFTKQAACATGIKVAKISLIVLALGIPFLGQVVGAALIAKLLFTFSPNKLSQHD